MGQYYKKYMKKREEEKPSYAKLFIGAFLLMIVFFMSVVIHFTPDTTIGENDEGNIKESGLGVKKQLIDSRLRFIQMEDSGRASVKENLDDKDIIQTYNKDIEVKSKTLQKEELEKTNTYKEIQLNQSNSVQKPTTSNVVTKPSAVSTIPAPVTRPSVSITQSVSKPVVPVTRPTVPVAQPVKTYTPSYQVQKNLAPTGMN